MTRHGGARPRVVALLPSWNAESFILPVLESLAAQTHPNFQVLISDDASTDRTPEICAAFAARHPNFRLIRQPRNLGWVDNVNFLLLEAAPRADYLFFAFHDDVMLADYVSRLTGLLEECPDAVLAYSDIEMFYLDGSRKQVVYTAMDGMKGRVARAKLMLWQLSDWWVPNRGVFRSSAVAESGGMRKSLAGEFSADWPWLLRLSLLGEFVRAPGLLCQKYHRKNSLSLNWNFGAIPHIAVTLTCAYQVRHSRLTLADKIHLHGTIVRRCITAVIRRCVRRLPSLDSRAEKPTR